MENDPSPRAIRKNALLYNIFDSRNEGTATAVEEIFMHAGLYDHNPVLEKLFGLCWLRGRPEVLALCMLMLIR